MNGVLPLLSVAVLAAPLTFMNANTTSPEAMVNPCVKLILPLAASLLAVAINEIAMY